MGIATLELLERAADCDVEFPRDQTCCGQPMANAGCMDEARPLAEQLFVRCFAEYDYVVSPSGSCVAMVRAPLRRILAGDRGVDDVRATDVRAVRVPASTCCEVGELAGRFPHRVGLHQSCHGLRELRTGAAAASSSARSFARPRQLLARSRASARRAGRAPTSAAASAARSPWPKRRSPA